MTKLKAKDRIENYRNMMRLAYTNLLVEQEKAVKEQDFYKEQKLNSELVGFQQAYDLMIEFL